VGKTQRRGGRDVRSRGWKGERVRGRRRVVTQSRGLGQTGKRKVKGRAKGGRVALLIKMRRHHAANFSRGKRRFTQGGTIESEVRPA